MNFKTRMRLGIFAVLLSVLLASAWVTFAFRKAKDLLNDQGTLGQFGDFVGGSSNPIIGVVTLLGLAITIVLQLRQLSYVREELDKSKEELKETLKELARIAGAQRELVDHAAATAKAQIDAAKAQEQAAQLQAIVVSLSEIKDLQDHQEVAHLQNDMGVLRSDLTRELLQHAGALIGRRL